MLTRWKLEVPMTTSQRVLRQRRPRKLHHVNSNCGAPNEGCEWTCTREIQGGRELKKLLDRVRQTKAEFSWLIKMLAKGDINREPLQFSLAHGMSDHLLSCARALHSLAVLG